MLAHIQFYCLEAMPSYLPQFDASAPLMKRPVQDIACGTDDDATASGFEPRHLAPIVSIAVSNRVAALTTQEIICLNWCKEGKTNWEIGEILVISEKTVEFHLSNVMKKLGATNRLTAVVLGLKNGLISL